MVDSERLERLRLAYQTDKITVYREYVQNLFLFYFYQKPGSEKNLFKGGTALRLVYKSPRFSEDLDFSATAIDRREIENILTEVLVDFDNASFKSRLVEAKPTMGGYLTNFETRVYGVKVKTAVQISSRTKIGDSCDTLSILNDYIPAYTAKVLPFSELAGEKVQAVLTRGKPRDFYDIYFLLRANLYPRARIQDLPEIAKKVQGKQINFKKEMSLFLPLSMGPLIKSFPEPLLNEIAKHFKRGINATFQAAKAAH